MQRLYSVTCTLVFLSFPFPIVRFFSLVYLRTMLLQAGNSTKFATRKEKKTKKPEDFQVILLNDHFTTMEFVVQILENIFHKNQEDAERIMWDVHQKGQGIVGQYPWDIAQTKANQVHTLAQKYEFPLRCIVEPM